MANRRPPWKIPAVINPPNRRCIQINIPDDPEHIAIFWGVLRGLSDWQRWEREPTKSGTLVAQVWREVVYAIEWEDSCMGCCPEPTNQYYDDQGILQVSTDGGVIYTPATDDPRMNSPLFPPLPIPPGDDMRCTSANNVIGLLKSNADQLASDAAAWGGITALIAAVGAIVVLLLDIATVGALTPLLLGLVAAMLSGGQTAFAAAMTEEIYGNAVCIVYCHTPDDGVYNQDAWQAIKTEIYGTITGIAGKFLGDQINAMGVAGLNNAARTGVSAGQPCDDCECSDCPCNIFAWNWPLAYGTPEASLFTRNSETCSLTADGIYHDTATGLYYFGVYAPAGCTMAAGIVSGSVNIFHGYIPASHTGSYSWFDTSHDWVSGIIPGPANCKAIIMVSTVPFLPYAVMA